MIDPFRYTTIAHAGRALLGPLGVQSAALLLEAAASGLARADVERARVLDIGCGKGELLVRAMLRLDARGLGVDPNAAFLAEARTRADAAGVGADLALVPSVFEPLLAGPRPHELVICTGATHAFGDYLPALAAIARLLAPGGRALVGVGYWRQPPAPEYLASFGGRADEMLPLADTLAAARAAGWRVLARHESTRDEWDAYEQGYAAGMRAWVAAHPHDPDAPAFGRRAESWAGGYERWGRDTMGFVTLVLARS